MDVVETAIRNAFEKGDAADRAFREKVYRSAFAALDRALKANTNVTVETAIKRRKNLQARIAKIESEFISAGSQVAPEISAVDDTQAEEAPANVELDNSGPSASAMAPEVTVDQGHQTGWQEPVVDISASPEPAMDMPVDLAPVMDRPFETAPARSAAREFGGDIRAERDFPANNGAGNGEQLSAVEGELPTLPERVVEPERRRRYPAVFAAVTMLSLGAIGLWWAYDTGLFKTAAEIDTSVPKPLPSTGNEDFDPDEEPVREPAKPGAANGERAWINVFSPGDPTQVSAPGDTNAQVMESESGSFIRIRSGSSGSAVTFDVGQGVLEQLAGKRAVFVIVARAEEGKETQISVDCNFGELGDCGRKRYAVGYQQGEFLFEIDLPNKRPGAGGSIAINSDIANQGRAIDVFEIKASVAR